MCVIGNEWYMGAEKEEVGSECECDSTHVLYLFLEGDM
jgi:hypothetical protein